jgi:hypothetical protein
MQNVIESAVSVGCIPIITLGAVGIHGATVIGIHGAGAPIIFAAITIGFAGELHIPNGITLTKGIISKIVPAGITSVKVMEVGKATRGVGATPNAHLINPPRDAVEPAMFYYPFS